MSLPRTLASLHRHLRRGLEAAGIDMADLDARLIIRRHTGLDWADVIARPETEIESRKLARIEVDIERRLSGMPVSRIFGSREFWGLEFVIGADTLDPRPDTETIVSVALERFQDRESLSILDLGTGSGCILIALLHEMPQARGIGMDRSFGALEAARANAQANGVADRAAFFCGSWMESVGRAFDLIVSNPPYIPNRDMESLAVEVRNHDPILALDGGEDGLSCYRNILTQIKNRLNPEGTLLLEVGSGQADDVRRLVEDSGLSVRSVHPDLAGVPRVVQARHGDK